MKMQKHTLHFTVVPYPGTDNDVLVANSPETGMSALGKTFEDALANLKKVKELYISEFPQETKGRAIHTATEVSSLAHK